MKANYGRGLVSVAASQARLYPGEPIDLELPATIEDLIRVSGEVAELARACREVNRQLDAAMIDHLGDHGHAKFGQTFYRVGAPEQWKVREQSRSRFFAWVAAHGLAPKLFNPNQARKKALSEMHQLPDPETGEVLSRGEFIDQFIDLEKLEQLKLEKVPESRWANWMRQVPEGTVRKGGPTKAQQEKEAELPDDDDEEEEAH
jgi:hypothetical protein